MGGSGIGPQIPPEIAAKLGIKGADHASGSPSDDESHTILPKSSKDGAIGPTMPPATINVSQPPSTNANSSSDDDDDATATIGPSAALAGCTDLQALNQTLNSIEARVTKRHSDQNPDTQAKRPDWMLVPPDSETRKTGLFDDSWTRTPGKDAAGSDSSKLTSTDRSKRRKKQEEEPIEETPDMRRRRLESEKKARWVDEYNKRVRPKSLLEMHVEAKHGKSKASKREKRSHRERHGDTDDASGDEWKRHRFDRNRDLGNAPRRSDSKKQREILNTIGFLSDKYAPGKGG
ncbi:hypothetical protein IW140_002805 [Coemansia sp. RSA 1813]|nr:hypothetical protein EV178_005470 [Coemansia sp. RSA 1646]KAJ1770286.1 hypothetical protein LPJ74_003347 [Coemansia sp. RSA 1843]KAJ2087547.1 hypothetical protein IW138_004917 [Coemansia sp. RSA 986]KAJ2211486.1 hypothetical protein EV179_005429 [Coemansia sp. RSA 487]KAJ2569917.1 hypothetical protein IW140_002805 [Coemansia sp. RSA 1813]